jgi:hypothetical protein
MDHQTPDEVVDPAISRATVVRTIGQEPGRRVTRSQRTKELVALVAVPDLAPDFRSHREALNSPLQRKALNSPLQREALNSPLQREALNSPVQQRETLNTSSSLHTPDPRSYREALNSPLYKHWKSAMQEEYASLMENDAFTFVKHTNSKPIGCKWVFKTKNYPDGTLRYKARLVVKGYEQIKGVDFDETYAPVGKLTTLRYLLCFMAYNSWKSDHLDVVTAFLNPEIDKVVYAELPEGIDWLSESNSPKTGFLRLNKALYGLKQAPRLWHQSIDSFLLSIGFHKASADHNLYICNQGVMLLLYVDDIQLLYAESAKARAIDVKESLMRQYKMKNLGPVKQFLGLEIKRLPDGSVTLGQQSYINSILQRYGMENANTVNTPMDHKTRLDNVSNNADSEADQVLYQSIVGSLMYAAQATRPDIAFAVAALSRYLLKPYKTHMTAAKRVLRYLKYTADTKLVFPGPGGSSEGLVGYTDSDWAGDKHDRKSQGGYIFKMAGAPISWKSKKQTVVARSTTEAEYLACSEATREAQGLVYLHRDVTGETAVPLIHCDSNGALSTIRSTVTSDKAKHIDVPFHNSRHLHAAGVVKFTEIDTLQNLADVLTKALPPEKHQYLTHGIGLRSPPASTALNGTQP